MSASLSGENISFYVRLHQSFVVPTVYMTNNVDFANMYLVQQIVLVQRSKFDCTPRQQKRTSKLLLSKNLLGLKLRSVVLHVTCTRGRNFQLYTRDHVQCLSGAGRDREYEISDLTTISTTLQHCTRASHVRG